MLKTSLSLLLLLASDSYRIVGEVVSSAKSGRATLESSDGRRVKAVDIGENGKFQFKKVAEGYYSIIVAMDKGHDIRRSIDVLARFADKDHRVPFRVDMEDAMRTPERASVSVDELSIPPAAAAEYRRTLTPGLTLDEVRVHLERAIAIAPRFAEALNDLGAIHFRQGEAATAIELFERAVEADPKSFFAHVNLGGALLGVHDTQRGLTENLAAIELRPEDSLAHAQAGVALFEMQQYREAIPQLAEAKRLDPLIPIAPGLYLAQIYDKWGQVDVAISEYNQFLKNYPNHASAYFVRSRVRELSKR